MIVLCPCTHQEADRPGRPSGAFRLAYFDAGPEAGIQAVYVGAARGTRQHGKRNRRGDRECGHLGSRASSPLTCSSQCKPKDVTELQLHNSRFTVIDAVRYKQNAGVGGKSFDARDELDDITTRGLESGRKAKRSTNRDDFIGFNISHHEEITMPKRCSCQKP